MTTKGWQEHEAHVQKVLGLDSTAASGAKFHDIGDAVDRRHPNDSEFRLLADAKYTEKGSYSVNLKFLRQMTDKALELGKKFILPVRLWPNTEQLPHDYVVVSLDDFAEMLEKSRAWDGLVGSKGISVE
jgi:hypothetical protein